MATVLSDHMISEMMKDSIKNPQLLKQFNILSMRKEIGISSFLIT